MTHRSSASRPLRLAIASVAAFSVGILIGFNAEAQTRFRSRVTVVRPVAQQRVVYRGPLVVRRNPVLVRRAPVFVRRTPVFVRPAPVVVQPAPVFVRPAPVFARPAPVVMRDAHGIVLTPQTRLIPGQIVRAQWGAGWFNAQVIGFEGDRVRIHYTGYSENWNESVPLHRLRIIG